MKSVCCSAFRFKIFLLERITKSVKLFHITTSRKNLHPCAICKAFYFLNFLKNDCQTRQTSFLNPFLPQKSPLKAATSFNLLTSLFIEFPNAVDVSKYLKEIKLEIICLPYNCDFPLSCAVAEGLQNDCIKRHIDSKST